MISLLKENTENSIAIWMSQFLTRRMIESINTDTSDEEVTGAEAASAEIYKSKSAAPPGSHGINLGSPGLL